MPPHTTNQIRESSVTFLLPVFNGARFLEESLFRLRNYAPGAQIICINDGSTDSTAELLERVASGLNLDLVSHVKNRGKGYSVRRALVTVPIKSEFVVVMDCDLPLQLDLTQVRLALSGLEHADVAVMSRRHPQSSVNRTFRREIVSLVHGALAKGLFPSLPTRDPDVGFKAYRRSFLLRAAHHTNMNRWSWDLETMVLAADSGFQVRDFPLQWSEPPGSPSTVRVLRDSLEEFSGMLYIRAQSLRGKLTIPNSPRPR